MANVPGNALARVVDHLYIVISVNVVMVRNIRFWKCVWLAIYNEFLGLGSAYVMLRMIYLFSKHGLFEGLCECWSHLGFLLWILQGVVLCDIVHAFAGVWSEDPDVPLLQKLWCKVGHRSELFITIYLVEDEIKRSWPLGLVVFTWALADISRYQMYTMRSIGITPPYWLLWCRYSDFIIQYPLNLIAEAALVVTALPHLWARGWGPYGIFSYAPIAALFNIYEFVIFIPAYWTLWKVRGRRLLTIGKMKCEDVAEVRCSDINSCQ